MLNETTGALNAHALICEIYLCTTVWVNFEAEPSFLCICRLY